MLSTASLQSSTGTFPGRNLIKILSKILSKFLTKILSLIFVKNLTRSLQDLGQESFKIVQDLARILERTYKILSIFQELESRILQDRTRSCMNLK